MLQRIDQAYHAYTDFETRHIDDDRSAMTGVHKRHKVGRCILAIGSDDDIHGLVHDLKKQQEVAALFPDLTVR